MSIWYVNNLVIGSCLDSFKFCQDKGDMLLSIDPELPVFVNSEYPRWHSVLFQLGVDGKAPFHSQINSVKLKDQVATVIYGNNNSKKIQFKKCYVFCDYRVSLENEILSETPRPRTVYDFFEMSKFEPHNLTVIEDSGDFAHKVVFYESGRLKNKLNTDIVVVSKILSDNFLDFDFSDTSCRFKARKMIEQKGVLGVVNRVDKKSGKVYRERINLSFVDRIIFNNDTRKYKTSKHVKFPNRTCKVR